MSPNWEPLVRITANEHKSVQERVASCLQAWQQKWASKSTRSMTAHMECLEAGEYLPSTGVSSVQVRVDSGRETLQFTLNESLVAGWVVAAGLKSDVIEMPRRGPLFERVIERVCQSLAALLLGVEESALKTVITHHQSPAKSDAKLWLIRARDEESRTLLCVALRPAVLESWLKRTAKSGKKAELQPLHAVFVDQSVSLRAVLTEIDVPYPELSQLACGDVLMLPIGADESVSVRSDSGASIASGRLGRGDEGCRAVGLDKVVAAQVAGRSANGQAALGGVLRGL
jgi:hypothetical protein